MVKTPHYFVIVLKTTIFLSGFARIRFLFLGHPLHALCANRFIATRMSDVVERGRECKVAGRGCGGGEDAGLGGREEEVWGRETIGGGG